MSTVEKILKSLALAALIAAAAVTVFHASWSLGIAIGAIAAGVVAGLAAINAAKDEILPGEEDFSADNLNGKASSSKYDPDDADNTLCFFRSNKSHAISNYRSIIVGRQS